MQQLQSSGVQTSVLGFTGQARCNYFRAENLFIGRPEASTREILICTPGSSGSEGHGGCN
jgi:hypothetical protein